MQSFMPRGKRLSPVQVWILLVLSKGPNYGYRIIQCLGRMFGGYWKPKAGTIYPALERLSDESLLLSRVEHREDTHDRRYYTITEKGQEQLNEAVMRWSKVIEHIELYGDAHRAIRQFRGGLSKNELGTLLIRMGEGMRNGLFDVSELIPLLEAETVEPTDPLEVKFLYAWENENLEIELEFEWRPQEKEDL